jgi:hypothetical protein
VIYYWPERTLSSKAQDLVEFDMASIRLLTHGAEPHVWLVSTDQYEQNGRVLRDSTSPRLVGYFSDTGMLVVTDGCNSCTHRLDQLQPELAEQLRKYI